MQLYMAELRVTDWPRSVAWYRDVLGLEVQIRDEAGKFALLGEGNRLVALVAGAGISSADLRLTFVVDDLEATRADLVRRGAECSAIAPTPDERFRSFRLLDPDGISIQIFAWDM